MHQSTLPCDFALPAEWEPQSAIMLTWPHAGTDWKPYLPEITDTYLELADIITRYEQLLVATPDVPATRYQLKKKLSAEQMSRVLLYEVESNDTWVRDHGPLTMVLRKKQNTWMVPYRILDFKFNGWGEKFRWEKDNAIVAMHTNMDAAAGGVNFKIAEKLGLRNVQFFAGEKEVDGVKGGEGVIGEVAEDLAADDLVLMLKERFGVECVQCNQLLRRPIRKVALCGGAGAFLLDAAIKAGADAFITGEMSYHEYFGHEQEIQICVIGHYQSEQFTGEIFRSIIQENFPDAKCCISEINTNPILYL
jgi:hypothetical protein